MKKVAITGSRSFSNDEEVAKYITDGLKRLEVKGPVVILAGGANGVDHGVKKYADSNDCPFVLFKPYHMVDNKVSFDPRFFFARNRQLVENCDVAIVIWDGISTDTKAFIDHCNRLSKPVIVHMVNPDDSK